MCCMIDWCLCVLAVVASMELRELEMMLKAAYANKERVAQMAEKEARKVDEKTRDMEVARVMAETRERDEQEERRREIERRNNVKKYFNDLDTQIKVRNH